MPAPRNPFKTALKWDELQIGCWVGLADPYSMEISAGAGFDWLLIDAEHTPYDLKSIVSQLQICAAFSSHAVVRPPIGEAWILKQLLDAGAQTLLVPMIESAEQAQAMADAVAYPPHGVRGVGAALARASNFAAIPDYLQTARHEICLLLQVENRAGVAALDDILKIDGVDGVFVGPSDLAADMGHIGNAAHHEVQAVVDDCLKKIVESGKAAGILTTDLAAARRYIDIGATFVAVGIDVTVFARGMRTLADEGRRFKASE